MKDLIRTKLDNFPIDQSILISELEKSNDKSKYIISIEKII